MRRTLIALTLLLVLPPALYLADWAIGLNIGLIWLLLVGLIAMGLYLWRSGIRGDTSSMSRSKTQ